MSSRREASPAAPLRRVGVVGYGGHASTSIHPNLRGAGFAVEAVCTRSRETASAAAEHLGTAACFDDAAEMLSSVELDGVVVVVPPDAYGPVVAHAIERRVPVFAEKPGAASVAEAGRLAAASADAGVPVVVGYQKRFAPAYQRAKSIIADPDFGPVTMAGFTWSMGPMRLSLRDWLFENPVHHFDLARFLLGELYDVHVVRGHAGEGHALAVTARTAQGAPVTMQVNTTGSWQQRSEVVEVFGQGHSLTVENVDTCTWRPPERPERIWRPNYTVPLPANMTATTMGFAGALGHFRQVVDGEAASMSDMTSAAETLFLTDEIWRQADEDEL